MGPRESLLSFSIKEEKSESQLAAMENQINRAERIVKDKDQGSGPKRQWFQTHKERMDEKERFKLASADGGPAQKSGKKKSDNQRQKRNERVKAKKNAKKNAEPSAEERARTELDKVMLMQARLAKKMSKPKGMRNSNDIEEARPAKKKTVKKSGSSFASDLVDTSRKSVKRLRYEGNTNNRKVKPKPKNHKK